MKVVAFLPAKGSSDRVPSKNLKLLDGKPLFLHTLEKLVDCDFIDEVYLDTESNEVIDYASEIDCKILKRDPGLATNKTDGNALFYNEVISVEADIYIQILGTSPFINIETIKKGIDSIKDTDTYDSAVLVKNEKLYTWTNGGPTYNIEAIPNSVDLQNTIIETMGLYIVKAEAAKRTMRRIGDKPYLLEASPLDALDVNWPEEFELANLVAAGLREKERKLFYNLKNLMTSCLLSDLLDDFGFKNQVISGYTPNFKEHSVLGRAKTLKLRKLKDEEDFKGIYNALYSYESIIPGDFIVVENEVPEYAYFGELNANLAIRSGAVGALIAGKTRDELEVKSTGFTVFSAGTNCQDVRGRATTESINKRITINNVSVSPGDLIYGDSEGVIVIPKSVEQEVIKEVIKRGHSEGMILSDISNGIAVGELTRLYGFF